MSAAVSAISSYLIGVVCRFGWQLFQLFGVTCLLAFLLQWSGRRIRSFGFSIFGKWYWYLVAPGVVCHEAGHALGCLLTGTKLVKMVPFSPEEDGTLGFVSHERRKGVLGGWANFVIATGPLWFGGIVIALLTSIFSGHVQVASYKGYFSDGFVPDVVTYGIGMAKAAVNACAAIAGGVYMDLLFALWLYLSFCIASEIGLSKVDILHMKHGLGWLLCLFLLLNVFPVVGQGVSALIYVLLPWIFRLHVLMLFSFAVNLILWGATLLIQRLVRCGRLRR